MSLVPLDNVRLPEASRILKEDPDISYHRLAEKMELSPAYAGKLKRTVEFYEKRGIDFALPLHQQLRKIRPMKDTHSGETKIKIEIPDEENGSTRQYKNQAFTAGTLRMWIEQTGKGASELSEMIGLNKQYLAQAANSGRISTVAYTAAKAVVDSLTEGEDEEESEELVVLVPPHMLTAAKAVLYGMGCSVYELIEAEMD